MGPWPSGSHQGLANHTNEEPWGQRGLLGKATAADHLCLQMQKVRMVIKCQVAMVIAIIVIIATIGIIAMMMYADEVEDGKEQVHGQCAGDLHYIPLAELLMAPITEIGPNWHQPTQAGPAKGVAHQHRSTSSTSWTI